MIQIIIKTSLSCLSQVAISYLFYVFCIKSTATSLELSVATTQENGSNSIFGSQAPIECDVTINDTAEDFDDDDLTEEERFFQKAILRNLM